MSVAVLQWPGLALVVMSVVEQRRLDAVTAVLSEARVTEVAAPVGVAQSLRTWVARYLVRDRAVDNCWP
jgi:hypothetical protein